MKFIQTFEKYKRTDNLSGVVLYVDGKLLLVHSRKHRKSKDMWSFPKGHIEGNSLNSALKELKEETGIKLDKVYDDKLKIEYHINGKRKLLDLYLYNKSLSDLSKFITDDYKVKKKYIKNLDKEIHNVKFFNLSKAITHLQSGQRQVINHLAHY